MHLNVPVVDGKAVTGFQFVVAGADVALVGASAEGVAAPAKAPGNTFDVLKSGTVRLGLRGLYTGGKVTVSAKVPKEYAVPEPLLLDVVQ